MAMRYTPYIMAACLLSAGLCFVPDQASASSAGWQPAVWLQQEHDYEQCESIGMDDYGNAMVVWEEPTTNYSDPAVYAARYDALSGWEEAVKVWNASFWCGSTTMAMGPEGDAFALVHADIDADTSAIYAIPYDPSTGWGEGTVIGESDFALDQAIAVDADGNAVAIWGALSVLYGAVYSPGDGWSAPETLDTSGSWPHVMFDRGGNAMAIWNDFDTDEVESKRYDPGTGWEPTVVASDPIGGYWVEMDVNDTGHTMAAWFLHNGHPGRCTPTSTLPASAGARPTLSGRSQADGTPSADSSPLGRTGSSSWRGSRRTPTTTLSTGRPGSCAGRTA